MRAWNGGGGCVVVASRTAQRRKELRSALESHRYLVAEVESAGQAIQEAHRRENRLLILDAAIGAGVPHELCRAIRRKSDLGIIVVAQDSSTQGRIDLLNAGADDCVPEPFPAEELMARVRALLRRVTRVSDQVDRIALQDREIDLRSHRILGPGNRITHLTPKEFRVLQDLLSYAGQPRTVRHLAQTVWQRDGSGELEYVRVVIGQLRRKLEPDPDRPGYIVTERAVGYRFSLPTGHRTHGLLRRAASSGY